MLMQDTVSHGACSVSTLPMHTSVCILCGKTLNMPTSCLLPRLPGLAVRGAESGLPPEFPSYPHRTHVWSVSHFPFSPEPLSGFLLYAGHLRAGN